MPSTASKLDIFNMALGFIGTRTIASANENTPEAIQCELYWDRARRSALRDYPYNFAQRRIQLAEKTLPEVYENEWRFCYGWPDKVLKVHRVHGPERCFMGGDAPFAVQNDGLENIILCDVDKAQAECTVDIEDISLWDELFVMAMARKLACLINVPLLKNNPNKVQELEQLYQMAIPRADGQNASEGKDKRSMDGWLAARGLW